MRRIAIAVLLLCALAVPAQNPNLTGVLNTGRLGGSSTINWWTNAGAGNIPTRSNCSTQPSLATGSGNAAANTTSLNTAIAACAGFQVNIPAGTYYFGNGTTTAIELETNNVSVLGAGADQTTIIVTNRDNCGGVFGLVCLWNGDGNYSAGPTHTANWTVGYAQGTTSITLDSTTGLSTGMFIGLDQINDAYNVVGTSTCTGTSPPIVDANIGAFSRTPTVVTAEGFTVAGFNSPLKSGVFANYPSPGGFPVTSYNQGTGDIQYSLAPLSSCPAGSAVGGVLMVDDGALTVTNSQSFVAVDNPGNNPGRPGNGGVAAAPLGGTVNTSGTTVTYVSDTSGAGGFGGNWNSSTVMNIAGTNYNLTGSCSSTTCTLASSAGTQTGATFYVQGLQGRSSLQWVKVTSITGSGPYTVGITPGVYDPHIRTDRSPGAWWGGGSKNLVNGVVFGNLTLDGSNVSGVNNISLYNGAFNWITGLRSLEAGTIHLVIWQSSHNTIISNYFWGIQGHGGSATQSYSTDMYAGSSDNLIANNIFQRVAVGMQNEGGMGNVYFYNFCIDNDNAAEPDFPLGDLIQHAPGTMFNLTEGNECSHLTLDNFHGSNGMGFTSFRTLWRGQEPGQQWQTSALQAATGSRNWNIIGSVLGLSGWHTKYYNDSVAGSYSPPCTSSSCNGGSPGQAAPVTILNTGFSGLEDLRQYTNNCNTPFCPTGDVNVNLPSAGSAGGGLVWANYDVVTGGVRFCGNSSDTGWVGTCSSKSEVPTGLGQYAASLPTLGDTVAGQGSLPKTFYSSTVFNSFGKTPWGNGIFPSIGPDVTGGNISGYGGFAYYNPAGMALSNMTIDNNYSTTTSITNATCSVTSSVATAVVTIGSQAANIDLADVIVVTGMTPSGYNTPTPATGTARTQVSATTGTTVSYVIPGGVCPGAFVSGGSAVAPVVFNFNAANDFQSLNGSDVIEGVKGSGILLQ